MLENLHASNAVTAAIRLHQNGDFYAAEAAYRHIMAADPQQADAPHFLALILHAKGDRENKALAMQLMMQSLALSPGNLIFINNLTSLYIADDQWENAIHVCKQVIAVDPSFVNCLQNLATAYRGIHNFAEAETVLQQALHIAPQRDDIHTNIGLNYLDQKRYKEAMAAFQAALTINANAAGALAGLGSALLQTNANLSAVSVLERAILANPAMPENYVTLANAHMKLMEYLPASEVLLRGISVNRNHYPTWATLLSVSSALGAHREVDRAFAAMVNIGPVAAADYSNYLLAKQYDPALSADQLFALHRDYAYRFEALATAYCPSAQTNNNPSKRLKIAYVSGDFRTHVVSNFMLPILEHHNRRQFEIICYYNHYASDLVTAQIRQLSDAWHDVSQLSVEQIVAQIRGHGIDILVDLSGHTGYNLLPVFALKPAPIQVTWIGYAGTTGLRAMDYRLTDAILDPVGVTDKFHTEKLLRLRCAPATFKPEANSPAVSPLPVLESGCFTFGSLNLAKKLNPQVIACWAKILAALPASRLIICDAGDAKLAERLLMQFAENGITPARLQMQPQLPINEFLASLRNIDLALDPFPYSGGTTSLHALWMGVPMITQTGWTTVSNVGAAILRPLGLDEFVADSETHYIELATMWAKNPQKLSAIRSGLRERMTGSESASASRVTLEVERCYREIWQKWCEKHPSTVLSDT